jgi:hypothetical protein
MEQKVHKLEEHSKRVGDKVAEHDDRLQRSSEPSNQFTRQRTSPFFSAPPVVKNRRQPPPENTTASCLVM